MSESVKSLDLNVNDAISGRNIASTRLVSSIDIEQTTGRYSLVQPYDVDGSYGGRVLIYPQSTQLGLESIIILRQFNYYGSLYYPLDAKFDYIRSKLWIADTGNHRVLKVDLKTYEVDVSVEDQLYYPHALAINLNDGSVFTKGFSDLGLSRGVVSYINRSGSQLARFEFGHEDLQASSSSSSSSQSSSSSSSSSINPIDTSSSFSSETVIPTMPSPYSIACDTTRSRGWWVYGTRVYMADTRNGQVQTYNLIDDLYYETESVDVELSTGNAFVVATNALNNRFVVQMFRDNNTLLASGYIT